MRVAIIGAGLAGTAAAYILGKAGHRCTIYDAGPALAYGASGNGYGFVNPRLSAFKTPESDFYAAAYALSVRTLDTIQATHDVGWRKHGTLHLIMDEKKQRRFPQTLANWDWPPEHMRLVNASEASEIAGAEMIYDALYLPDSGMVSPARLCAYFAQGHDVKFNTRVTSLSELEEDIIILACGETMTEFEQAAGLPIKGVRGQITHVRANKASQNLRCNITFGGYCSPSVEGEHVLGATYQRWLEHAEIRDEDDAENISRLCKYVPALATDYEVTSRRASRRCSAKDYFPVIGQLPGTKHIYLSAAHGSHGISTALAGAHLLADMISGKPYSLSSYTVNALAAERFQ